MARLGTFFGDHCKWKIKQHAVLHHPSSLSPLSFQILSRKWCASFSSQGTHETIRTARAVATEAGKVTILAGGIGQHLDHDTSESCYDIMTCYCTNMQAILKSRNSSGSLWIPAPPPHVATHHFFRNFIKEVFNFFAWKGRSSTNICTAMIHRSTRLSDVN